MIILQQSSLNSPEAVSDPPIHKEARGGHNTSCKTLADHLNVRSQGLEAIFLLFIRYDSVLSHLYIKLGLVVMPRMHGAHPAQTTHDLVVHQEYIVVLTELLHFCEIPRPRRLAAKCL